MTSHPGLILLVEDDADLRAAFEFTLRRRGYKVVSTGCGLRAVELAVEHQPTLAVVDLLLPGQSGFQVSHALRERFGDNVRVLVMSGYTSSHHRDYAAASGAEAFLAKPFSEVALIDAVEALCPAPIKSQEPFETRRRVKIGA
ncbi:Transcriptional regulatory protein YycF [Gemmata obscuriglobus]|uniref:response regulator n=1 Tax=Gemmata obscuriglobus TaxID=114 RepID=UPI00016C442E|nr:response regulator [Gemmata obscuriglobus]QEG30504.1 Transcriptional regulatory protein YycF [Gemmata obscuriglobus]VTS09828.1 chemotaxis protein : Putative OmpR family two-component response regulator OS=Caldilinea aerophila (strain DSM 14535 / JCM 11387 / NBRC 104270 / STL-6-O1) GN=CLDAP_00860 PE=4 SV=1: Response_reg [Gemmata obscuriglobus UQM 2246]